MIPAAIHEIAERCGGRLLSGDGARIASRLHTDSRTLCGGDCYIALAGEKFDGHDFVGQAAQAGAVAAIVSRSPKPDAAWPKGLAIIECADTLLALQAFAADYRRRRRVKTVAVTGSSGKTSTKEIIAAVLRQRFATHATRGNLNNHIGVPLTLLALDDSHEYGVIEMGMNHPGELRPLVSMAAPEMGVITNVGTAHIEFFDNQEGIAVEKSEVIAHLPSDGAAFLNADNAFTPFLQGRTRARVVLAGVAAEANVRADDIEVSQDGLRFTLVIGGQRHPARLPIFSRPMVVNGLLAAAVGHAVGMALEEIVRGLASVELPGHRMKVSQHEGRWIINDAYNANADSMSVALQALREFPSAGRKLAVLGSMGELGARAVELHRLVGRAAAESGLARLIAVGPNAADILDGARAYGMKTATGHPDRAEALAALRSYFTEAGDCVLVKGSRFMELDKLVAELIGETSSPPGHH